MRGTLADELSDAIGFIETAAAALRDEDQAWPAMLVLEHGILELRRVHAELDRAGT